MSPQTQKRDFDSAGPAGAPARSRSARRRRAFGVVLSIACHALILLVVLSAPAVAPRVVEPQPIAVELVDASVLESRTPAAAPPAPAKAPVKPKTRVPPKPHAVARRTPAKSIVRRGVARPKPARRDTETLAADVDSGAGSEPGLSDAQLAGAETAGAGGGGGSCDMTRRLQEVLRKDPLVHVAVAGFAGKAVMVWNGDWVWFHGDVGRGLTAVRQAMAWEIAFAPEACRAKPMHGLVVLSLNEAQGPVRLAVGLQDWRWSDLLKVHE